MGKEFRLQKRSIVKEFHIHSLGAFGFDLSTARMSFEGKKLVEELGDPSTEYPGGIEAFEAKADSYAVNGEMVLFGALRKIQICSTYGSSAELEFTDSPFPIKDHDIFDVAKMGRFASTRTDDNSVAAAFLTTVD